MDLGSYSPLANEVRARDVLIYNPDGTPVTFAPAGLPANAALTSVATSTTSAELLAANAARRQVFIHNASSADLYVAFAATATTTAFTVLIPKNSAKEFSLNGYTGVISGILSSGSGNARITEVTA